MLHYEIRSVSISGWLLKARRIRYASCHSKIAAENQRVYRRVCTNASELAAVMLMLRPNGALIERLSGIPVRLDCTFGAIWVYQKC